VSLTVRSTIRAHRTTHQASALVLGCGSVGSLVGVQLARAGILDITLWDPDMVEEANMSRGAYTTDDLGMLKVEALRDHLLVPRPPMIALFGDAPVEVR
jgi:tRNA A37 threonylcarbamoyladenosine dehydratase